MNVVEQYNLTLQIEVLKEQSAETLARLCNLVEESDTSDCVELLKAYSHIVNTELYLATSIHELDVLKSDMVDLESNIKESLAQASHDISDVKAVKETSDVQAIESYSSEDFDKALERTIDFLTFNKNISIKNFTSFLIVFMITSINYLLYFSDFVRLNALCECH